MKEKKSNFISNELTKLCQAIDKDITEMKYFTLDSEEFLKVKYTWGEEILCISADSLTQIVIDTLHKLFY